MEKTIGYIMRYGGGATIAWTVLQSYQHSMLPEETIGGVIAGGIIYMIGDRMKQREFAEKQIKLEEKRLEADLHQFHTQVSYWKKIDSHLEKIVNGKISPNLPDDK